MIILSLKCNFLLYERNESETEKQKQKKKQKFCIFTSLTKDTINRREKKRKKETKRTFVNV